MFADLPSRLHHAVRWGSQGTDSEETDRFLQERVAVFAMLMGGLFSALYIVGAAIIWLFIPEHFVEVHVHPGKIVNLLLMVLFVGAWLFLREKPRQRWMVRACDVAGALSLSCAVGYGTATAPVGLRLELAGLLVVVLAMVMRAALIPSRPLFTVLVGLACAPPLVLGCYTLAKRSGSFGFMTPELLAVGIGMWCIAATAATATVSRVIYGLVEQMQKAMRLGRYTLGDKLGEGGMGVVYRAEHAMLRRPTAIKLLLPERVGPAAQQRFEREVQLTSQLSHPNTIAIHDYGKTPAGIFYYAMEYLEGRSLDRLLADEGPQPPGRVVHVLMQVAGSLREAHAVGLIHRDIKPGNVLIGERGGLRDFVKVIDFGLVKQLAPSGDAGLTRADALTGTPLYMAPENVTAPDEVSAKLDTYALGAVGYFMVTGTPPFNGKSIVEVCSHHMQTPPTPPSQRLGAPVAPLLEALILRCLAKEPAQRPDDEELLRLLQACQRESPWGDLEQQRSAQRPDQGGPAPA
jgi:eukaryotic-like serine/threonine-protein kinase